MDEPVIMCDEIIDVGVEAKTNDEAKSNDKEKKLIQQVLVKKIWLEKFKIYIFYFHFY